MNSSFRIGNDQCFEWGLGIFTGAYRHRGCTDEDRIATDWENPWKCSNGFYFNGYKWYRTFGSSHPTKSSFEKKFSFISLLKFLICRQCHLFNYIYLIRLILSLFLLSFQSELGYWRRCWAIYYHVRVIKFNHDCRHIWVSKRIGNAMMYVLSFDSSVKWWLLQFFPECCNLLFLW